MSEQTSRRMIPTSPSTDPTAPTATDGQTERQTAPNRTPDRLPIALRAFTEAITEPEPENEQPGKPRRKRRGGRAQREDEYVLVLDPETTIDRCQRLTFGVYRYYRTHQSRSGVVTLTCVDEGIFHDDDLPERDPDAYRLLWEYAKYREPAVDQTVSDAAISIRLLTAGEMRELLYVVGYELRALVVGFNLPFDLSRLAIRWRDARTERFAGGFSLGFWDYEEADGTRRENRYRPDLSIKSIDSKRALKGFTTPAEIEPHNLDADGRAFRGHLLDLRTIAFALTDRGHTLESASAAFGVPYVKREVEHGRITAEYIDYCREDVAATTALYEAISAEHRRHPIDLQPTKAYSPASIGKAYLKAMGVKPILERQPDFPRDVLGWSMSAYYGGRTECRIRRVGVPIVYSDFLSMYPTVNALMGLWDHVTAARIEIEDVTEKVRALVQRLGVQDCLDPATWRELPALVQIKPDGDVLPVRARYGDGRSWNIGSNPLWSAEPLWCALPDVIASKLITGQTPEIIRALALVPAGRQRGMKPIKLRGEVQIDPRKRDLFQAGIEERRRLSDKTGTLGRFLKTFANGTSYGIYAEMNRRELTGNRQQEVNVYGLGDEPFTAPVSSPEQPGAYAFPPIAACITAAARLLLATLETLVVDAGGTWAFCDTDSMAIVATEHGGLVPCPGGPVRDEHSRECVRALSFGHLDEIVGRFEALNPYDRAIVPGSVLEIEGENYDDADQRRQLHCYSISAKRYALYNLDEHGQPILRKTADDDESGSEPAGDETTDALAELRKHSEHGLGHLLNPTDPEEESRDWIAQLWRYIIRTDALKPDIDDHPTTSNGQRKPATGKAGRRSARDGARGKRAGEPGWLDRPALTRTTISSPRLLKPFTEHNRKHGISKSIRPYNFLLVAHVSPGQQPSTDDYERFLLVAPYESDPRKWLRLPWTNAYQPGSRHAITTTGNPEHDDALVQVKTYRYVLDDYRTHPEAKSLGPDGRPCDRATAGLLHRRPVKVAKIHHIGKESNRIEESISGLVTDLGDVLNEYREDDPLWKLTSDVILTLAVEQVAAGAGASTRTVKRARAGRSISKTARAKLTNCAARHARTQLRAPGYRPPIDREALLATYIDHTGSPEPHPDVPADLDEQLATIAPEWRRAGRVIIEHIHQLITQAPICSGCGRLIIKRGRRGPTPKWHSDKCRKRAQRSALTITGASGRHAPTSEPSDAPCPTDAERSPEDPESPPAPALGQAAAPSIRRTESHHPHRTKAHR